MTGTAVRNGDGLSKETQHRSAGSFFGKARASCRYDRQSGSLSSHIPQKVLGARPAEPHGMRMAKIGICVAFFRIANRQQPDGPGTPFRGTKSKLARLARDDQGEFSWPQE
jgi:hypothetical protein